MTKSCTCWKIPDGFPPVMGDALFSKPGQKGTSCGKVHARGDEGCWMYINDRRPSREAILEGVLEDKSQYTLIRYCEEVYEVEFEDKSC
jgi:hypothetical protein